MKILTISRSGIGDMIMFTPVIRNLRRAHPDAQITLLGPKSSYEVLRGSDLIDEHIEFSSILHGGIIHTLRTLRSIRKHRFDLSITAFDSFNRESALICVMGGIKKTAGHHSEDILFTGRYDTKVRVKKKRHNIETNLDILRKLKLPVKTTTPEVYVSDEDVTAAKQKIRQLFPESDRRKRIGFHTGCGPFKWKIWPHKHFREVMNNLAQEHDIIHFVGPDDRDIEGLDKRIKTVKGMTYKQVAALIGECDLFISNDSGLMHTAVAANTKTIGIFGPSNYHWLGPYGNKHSTIKLGIKCSPCYWRLGQEYKCVNRINRQCLRCLKPAAVINAIRSNLNPTTQKRPPYFR